MNSLQALLLGLLQGLTEYLPVSSSGHLAIGAYLFGVDGEESMAFTIVVHVATVLSTLVILWREIVWVLRGLWNQMTVKTHAEGCSSCAGLNAETRYAINILISMIPVGIVGLFFKDQVEMLFSSLYVVGGALLVTAVLLYFSDKITMSPLYKPNTYRNGISFWQRFILSISN